MSNISNFPKEDNKNQQTTPEEKHIEKIITGKVVSKPKSGFKKFIGKFVESDARSIGEHVQDEIIVPMIKDTIVNAVQRSIEIFMYGGSAAPKKNSRFGRSLISKVSYEDYYDNRVRQNKVRSRVAQGYDYDDIILESRGDAQLVLDQLDDLIERYGFVSVADLCSAVGMPFNFTAQKFGWNNIRSARIQNVHGGWLIKMPKAEALD